MARMFEKKRQVSSPTVDLSPARSAALRSLMLETGLYVSPSAFDSPSVPLVLRTDEGPGFECHVIAQENAVGAVHYALATRLADGSLSHFSPIPRAKVVALMAAEQAFREQDAWDKTERQRRDASVLKAVLADFISSYSLPFELDAFVSAARAGDFVSSSGSRLFASCQDGVVSLVSKSSEFPPVVRSASFTLSAELSPGASLQGLWQGQVPPSFFADAFRTARRIPIRGVSL